MTLGFSQDKGVDLHAALFLAMAFMKPPKDYVSYLGRRGWKSQLLKVSPWSAGRLVPWWLYLLLHFPSWKNQILC